MNGKYFEYKYGAEFQFGHWRIKLDAHREIIIQESVGGWRVAMSCFGGFGSSASVVLSACCTQSQVEEMVYGIMEAQQ